MRAKFRQLPQAFRRGHFRLTFRCWLLGHRWSEWRPTPLQGFEPIDRHVRGNEDHVCLRRGCRRAEYREPERA